MRRLILTIASLTLSLLPVLSSAQDETGARYEYSLWLGTHYTDFQDNAKKVGEYNLGNDEAMPEGRFSLSANKANRRFSADLRYFDHKNIHAQLDGSVGTRLDASVRYRSMIGHQAQDFLTNMETREWLGDKPGGKMVTHEITDPNADFNIHRNEIEADLSVLLSEKGNVRMIAAHRSIIESCSEQKVASNHCFSCHLVSESVDVDRRTYIVKAGLEAATENLDVGYTFGYRKFHSKEPDPTGYFDPAKHPVNGGAVEEFSSRVAFDDVILPYSAYPETEKMSHKARLGANVGTGRLTAAVSYSQSENKRSELKVDAVGGSANYRLPLSPRTRLTAKVSATRLSADDPFIDLPLWRADRPGETVDFSYTRYSVTDRLDLRGSAEVTTRLSRRATLSVIGGLRSIARDDYPLPDDGLTTSSFFGQAKLRYRKGTRYAMSLKYRFTKTSDPLISGRGLFEARGRDVLDIKTPPGFAFYYQREDLRYQDITTLPTDEHDFHWRSTYRPSGKVSLGLGLHGSLDKNGELDSLDVEHLNLRPDVSVTLIPDVRWSITSGYTFSHFKSRGPVTVALFDG
jgi:hypothetical protein